MVEEEIASGFNASQVQTLSELVLSSPMIQIALIILVIGIISIVAIHRSFARWANSKRISHIHPELAEFTRKAILPFFAIAIITSVNVYVQTFELFDERTEVFEAESSENLTQREVFAKLLTSMNIFAVGYAASQLIPILITKYDRIKQEHIDFDSWKMMTGFADDEPDFFHKIFEWIPPKYPPKNMSDEIFHKLLKTKKGRKRA